MAEPGCSGGDVGGTMMEARRRMMEGDGTRSEPDVAMAEPGDTMEEG